MTIAIWSSRYETGIALIDAQHRSLFDAVNRLADSFQAGTSNQQARECLEFMVRYTEEHFRSEEAYMRDMNYPHVIPHEAEHARLIDQVHQLQAKVAEGRPVTMDMAIFLADWLKRHINETDMGYVNFVKDKAEQ